MRDTALTAATPITAPTTTGTHGLAKHHGQDAPRGCAQRQANAEFPVASADRVRHDTVDANRGQQERQNTQPPSRGGFRQSYPCFDPDTGLLRTRSSTVPRRRSEGVFWCVGTFRPPSREIPRPAGSAAFLARKVQHSSWHIPCCFRGWGCSTTVSPGGTAMSEFTYTVFIVVASIAGALISLFVGVIATALLLNSSTVPTTRSTTHSDSPVEHRKAA